MAGFNQKSENALHDVTERLVRRYGGPESAQGARVPETVDAEADRFRDARVHAFVPILVERAVRGRLEMPRPAG